LSSFTDRAGFQPVVPNPQLAADQIRWRGGLQKVVIADACNEGFISD